MAWWWWFAPAVVSKKRGRWQVVDEKQLNGLTSGHLLLLLLLSCHARYH
jgi:hypothetical protein